MHLRFLFPIGFLALILMITSLSPTDAATPTMDVDELERGMRGIGRTVFHGTRIDSFQVEILGVLRNAFGPDADIILARLSGDPLEKTGGIAGMSGSPVYVDGKMIGAVAYGWSFSIEPIMGITPIREMLGILERSTYAEKISSVASYADADLLGQSSDDLRGFDAGQMQPVKTPVYVSGFSSDVVPGLTEHLSTFGLMPVQGGGAVDTTLQEASLEPGAALGVQLIRGDFNMTAIGTLTHIEGDRLVGFGHPMLSAGSTRLPMTTAFIHDVVPNQFQSFKLGAAVKQVGAITQDRATGIGGILGQEAEMIPTEIRIRSESKTSDFSMEVLRNRDLGPLLIQSAVVSALVSSEKARGQTTVRTKVSLRVKDQGDLVFGNVFAGSRGLGEGVLGVTRPLQLLMQNPFEVLRVESVSFELDVAEDVKAARIQSIALDRAKIEAGDKVGIEIELRPYLQPLEKLRTTVQMPSHIRQGSLILRVSSARVHLAQESKRVPAHFRVSDLDGLVSALKREHGNDILIVELLANQAGATVGGQEMSSLPPSVVAAMKMSRHSDSVKPVNQTVVFQSLTETPYVLSGQQTVFLSVGKEGAAFRFSPQAGPVPKKN